MKSKTIWIVVIILAVLMNTWVIVQQYHDTKSYVFEYEEHAKDFYADVPEFQQLIEDREFLWEMKRARWALEWHTQELEQYIKEVGK